MKGTGPTDGIGPMSHIPEPRHSAGPSPLGPGEVEGSFGYRASLRTPYMLVLLAATILAGPGLVGWWSASGGGMPAEVMLVLLACLGAVAGIGGMLQLAWRRAEVRDGMTRLFGHLCLTPAGVGMLAWLAAWAVAHVPAVHAGLARHDPSVARILTDGRELPGNLLLSLVVTFGVALAVLMTLVLPVLAWTNPALLLAGTHTSDHVFDLDSPLGREEASRHARLLHRQVVVGVTSLPLWIAAGILTAAAFNWQDAAELFAETGLLGSDATTAQVQAGASPWWFVLLLPSLASLGYLLWARTELFALTGQAP